ncbi:MAG: 4Fe-4S binding protein [Desulfitobacteriaceae bacterium]
MESCASCGICANGCPVHAITMTDKGNGIEEPTKAWVGRDEI